MVYCIYTDVKRIVTTSLADADITALIVLADAEITARGLTTLNSDVLKAISMYLTADMIQPETTTSGGLGALNAQSPLPPNWRERAETLIAKSSGLPIYVGKDTEGLGSE